MLQKYKAFIFDLNGTMVDDMSYHINAWHELIQNLGGQLSLGEMKHQCYGKNDELLERVFPGKYTLAERIAIGNKKEAIYRKEYKPLLKLIAGLERFLQEANARQVKMGIGSAAIMENIRFVLDNTDINQYFSAIISSDEVETSKPDPETFLKCAYLLNIPPQQALVFEDTPKGVACASNAGMDAIVILGEHKRHEFNQFPNVIHYINDYHSIIDYLK